MTTWSVAAFISLHECTPDHSISISQGNIPAQLVQTCGLDSHWFTALTPQLLSVLFILEFRLFLLLTCIFRIAEGKAIFFGSDAHSTLPGAFLISWFGIIGTKLPETLIWWEPEGVFSWSWIPRTSLNKHMVLLTCLRVESATRWAALIILPI